MTNLEAVETDAVSGDRYYYWSDGAAYPSVTTVLSEYPPKKKAIKKYRERHPAPDRYMERQGLVGTIVHHRTLNQLAVRPLEPPPIDLSAVDDEIAMLVDTACAMWEQLDIEIGDQPFVEEPIRNDEYEYAGRFDLVTDDGVLYDLKVSRGVYDSYKMQCAAYSYAINSMKNYPTVDEAGVVVLHPRIKNNPSLTPQITRLDRDDLDKWFDEFGNLRQTFSG